MKRALNKIISVLLVMVLLWGVLPLIHNEATAVSQNQQNIVDWADYYYNTTWICKKTISGWKGNHTFYEGETYHLPYGQPVTAGAYIGYGVSLDDFLLAADNAESVFYSQQSAYNGLTSVYYATDCSAFVSACWGISRNTTASIPGLCTYLGMATEANLCNYLQLGDAINSKSAGHVILVTDLLYDTNGKLKSIEITEQTPPQLKRTIYTPNELASRCAASYGIYRYNGTVPDAPERSYIDSCTPYHAYCQISVLTDSAIMTLPCDATINRQSQLLDLSGSDEEYTAIALYRNTEGELWYAVAMNNDGVGYILASETSYLYPLKEDVVLLNGRIPSGIVAGKSFTVSGTVKATYNQLTEASAYIHLGFGISGNTETGASDVVTGNHYVLAGSTIDRQTSFGILSTGNYTMVISADYQSYYTINGVDLITYTDKMVLAEDYFMVIPEEVSTDSCVHNYREYLVSLASCTEAGKTVKACATCGLLETAVEAPMGHVYGNWGVRQPTCTTEGYRARICASCGFAQKEVLPALGHDYDKASVAASCLDYAHTLYTCGRCGDSYAEYPEQSLSDWQETKPEGFADALLDTKTQYRYTDYELVTSYEPILEGYTSLGLEWERFDTGKLSYVQTWPEGFDTTNGLYETYGIEPFTFMETEEMKTVVEQETVSGYLYYHWCRGTYHAGPSNRATSRTQTETFCAFHGFYSENKPDTMEMLSDQSVRFENGNCCKDTYWYYYIPVYTQSYTRYRAVYTHSRWTSWSEWSDEEIEGNDLRQVEIRTLYRYNTSQLGDHSWSDGICLVCGTLRPEEVPVISLQYPTLHFEDEIKMNIFFEVTNLDCIEQMGLITYSQAVDEWDVYSAENVIAGGYYHDADDYYYVSTTGIPPHKLGFDLYFAVYVKVKDGSYYYSKLVSYSPRTYAYHTLNSDVSAELKTLVAAMLNYGAAAQVYFSENTGSLVNAQMSQTHANLVAPYHSSMIEPMQGVDKDKQGQLIDNGGFTKRYPNITLEGAFAINYYFVPAETPAGDVTLYYWTQADFDAAEVLTAENATGAKVMDGSDILTAAVTGIAAKDLNDVVYVAAMYENHTGEQRSSGVLPYSIGAYCESVEAGGGAMQPLAAATAVYGYYANGYFA